MSDRALVRGVPLTLFVLAALLSTWCVTAARAAQDPVAAYSFDAGEGTIAEDVTGNEHEGTIEGASWFGNGRFGSVLSLQGEKGECVRIPDAEDLRITEELTVEAWVKPRAPVEDDPIVYKSAYGYTGDALGIGVFNSGKPEGFLGEGEGEYESVVGPKALEANVWSHLALTFDGAHMRLYVNGELVATKAQSEGAPWGEGDLTIGCNPNFPSEVFNGLIDEVRIYNRALSAAELTADAGAALQTPSRTPVAAYSFDAGEGETLEDVTGDEHEGAVEGASWFDNGRYGKALDFDGEDDCVTVENAPDLQLTEELTLEAWVKSEGSGKSEPVIFKEAPFFGTYSLYLGIGEEGHMEGLIGEEGYVFKDTEDPEELELGAWSHVALTFDGAHMRLYVNGELVDTTAAEGAWSSTGPLSIGCSKEFEDNFDGLIDEVRVYNRALSAGEVAEDAGAGLQTPSRTPVAAYSLDAGEGTVAEDAYGEHDGTIEGAEWSDNGRFGKALNFDGEEGDCVSVEDAPDLQLTEELTLEAWVKPKGSGASEPIIFKETPYFFGYSLYLGINEHGHMEGLVGEEGYEAEVTEDPAKLETDVWSHIALTFDGSHMRLYVNGQLVDTTKAEGAWGTTGPLSIGCSEEFEDNFNGLIDEVRIYNRALSAGEVTADAGSGLQTPQNTPAAAYSFDAGEGEVAEDVTGDEHEGTIEGASWFENGRFGKALSFDGENDCVTVEDAPDLQLTEELTLEAWVKPEGSGKSEPVIFKETPFLGTYSLYLGIGEEGHMEGLIGEEGYVFKDTEDPEKLETGVWNHVALTFDGAHMRLYVNGALVDTTAAEGAWSSSGPLSIGCSEEFEDNFDGKIDEVRIYNRALGAGEIAADAGTGLEESARFPVVAYSFDAGEGEVLEDVSAAEHEGAIEGATWFDNGRYGKALSFDGENDCVTVEDAPDLQLTEELTLEAWVKPKGSGASEPIIFKETPYFFGYSLYLGINEHGHMEGLIGEEGYEAEVTEDPAKLEMDVWSHIALTFDGAHMRLYVNGQLVDTTKAEGPWGTTGPLSIGCSEEFEDNYKGLIDEVRIYNRALSQGEIAADMGAEVPNPPTAVTGEAEVLGPSEAIFSGTVDPNETETTYRFEYGTTTAYGQTAPATEEEVLYEDTAQEAEEAVAYLQPSTTYHYRLVATNQAGTAVGEDKTLTTPPSEVSPEQEIKDREEEENYTASISTVPPDFVGLNFRGLQERTNSDMEKVAETGASIYRISLEDLTHFSAERSKYDEVFLNAAANHMKVLFVLGSRHLTTNKSGLATWVERIVRRYGKARAGKAGSIWSSETAPFAPTAWEVWNEPNIGLNALNPPPKPDGPPSAPADQRPGNVDPKKFGDYLETMSKAIKNVEPHATVILGGLLAVGNANYGEEKEKEGKEDEINPEKFLSKMEHTDDYDAVGFHPYAFRANNGEPPHEGPNEGKEVNEVRIKVRTAIVRLRKKLDHLKDGKNKELWITEVGWPVAVGDRAHPAVSEDVQAKLVKSVFSTIKKRSKPWKIANVFYFNYRDAPRGTPQAREWDFNTGLLDAQGNPKPAFEAFKLQTK